MNALTPGGNTVRIEARLYGNNNRTYWISYGCVVVAIVSTSCTTVGTPRTLPDGLLAADDYIAKNGLSLDDDADTDTNPVDLPELEQRLENHIRRDAERHAIDRDSAIAGDEEIRRSLLEIINTLRTETHARIDDLAGRLSNA